MPKKKRFRRDEESKQCDVTVTPGNCDRCGILMGVGVHNPGDCGPGDHTPADTKVCFRCVAKRNLELLGVK